MQHEIVLALLGCPGDLITKAESKDGNEPVYLVSSQFSFLSTAERETINQIISLGASYEVLLAFIDGRKECFNLNGYQLNNSSKNNDISTKFSKKNTNQDGLFGRAFKDGIEKQLSEYREFIIKCETELISDSSLPISHLKYKISLNHYNSILPALSNLVLKLIHRHNFRLKKMIRMKQQHNIYQSSNDDIVFGSQLLELIHEGITIGPVPVSKSFERLARHCHAVMLKLISTWTLHGSLMDPFLEFFVVRSSTHGSTSTKLLKQQDLHNQEEEFVQGRGVGKGAWQNWSSSAWDDAPWNLSKAIQSSSTTSARHGMVEEEDWNKAFTLRIDAIPLSMLPTSMAQQILFIGKAVRTLNRGHDIKPNKHFKVVSQFNKHSNNVTENDDDDIGLTENEIEIFEQEYARLTKQSKFQLLQFESLIRKQHHAVAERLWRLVVVKGGLLQHLQNVRNLVLMGSGELWHEVILSGKELLATAPNNKSEDLFKNGPLKSAIRQCIDDDDYDEDDEDEHHSGGGNSNSISARLQVSLLLQSFNLTKFDSMVGFTVSGTASHNRAERSVLLVSPLLEHDHSFTTNQATTINKQQIDNDSYVKTPTKSMSGSLISLGKKKIRRSFSTVIKFSWSAIPVNGSDKADDVIRKQNESKSVSTGFGPSVGNSLKGGVVRICFVIANDPKQRLDPSSSYQSTYVTNDLSHNDDSSCDVDGVSNVANALAIILEMSTSGAKLLMSKSGDTSDPSIAPVVLDETHLPRRPIADSNHWLLVEYEASTEMSEGKISVYLDDPKKTRGPPSLSSNIAIHKAVALDVSAGDAAYVKVLASVSANKTNDITSTQITQEGLPLATVSVLQWEFGFGKDSSFTLSNPNSIPPSPSSSSSSSSYKKNHQVVLSQCERQLEACNAWDELCCSYRVDWPLRLIITEDSENQYNKIFQMLWPTKRAQVELESVWRGLMSSRYRNLPKQDNVWLRPLQLLQAQMLFFVKNLQTYLQVDVVEAQFKIMKQEVEQHRDFDSVRRAHHSYLRALLSKSHVQIRPFYDSIKRMIIQCRKFTLLFQAYSNAGDIPHNEIVSMKQQFSCDGNYLFLLLQRNDAQELATRLDYNGWFSNVAQKLTGDSDN